MFGIVAILLLIVVLTFSVVHRGVMLTPDEALSNYLEACRRGRTDEAYGYLSSAAKASQSLEEFRKAKSLGNGLLAEIVGRHVSFVVETIETGEDRAAATVVMTAPDFKLILRDILQELDPAGIPEPTMDSFAFVCCRLSELGDKYEGEKKPLRTTREDFYLCREAEGWKIMPQTANPGT